MDILFVHPNAASAIYQELSELHSAIETPIWAGMLANHVRQRGFGVGILDCEANAITHQYAATKVKDINPRIVCVVVYGQQPSASTQNMEGAVMLAEELKRQEVPAKIVFVGTHCAALPEDVLHHDAVDFVCQNEGVTTLSNLVHVEDLDNHLYLEKVPGLGWKRDGLNILNRIAPIIPQDKLADELPGIAWDLLPPQHYRTAGWHSWSNQSVKTPFASLYTSLGCPYSCRFCCINMINRTDNTPGTASNKSAVFRYWAPESIISEFDKLAQMGVRNVKIADELFVLREQHFMKVCDLLIERDYGFNIWCYSRIDTCKPHYLDKLKQAGINWIGLGIESPNQVVRRDVVKGGYKEVKITDLLHMIANSGIHVGANYIFGLPEDTQTTMEETLAFALHARTENCNFYTAMSYPGSPLYYTALDNGWTLPDRYAGYSQHSYWTQNLPSRHAAAADILRFRDEAWMKYFTDESYLRMIADKFGEPAVENIRSTTKIRLKRRLLGDAQ